MLRVVAVEFLKSWFEDHGQSVRDLDTNQPEVEKIVKCVRMPLLINLPLLSDLYVHKACCTLIYIIIKVIGISVVSIK